MRVPGVSSSLAAPSSSGLTFGAELAWFCARLRTKMMDGSFRLFCCVCAAAGAGGPLYGGGSSHFCWVSAKEGTLPSDASVAAFGVSGLRRAWSFWDRVRRISPGPNCPLLLSGAGERTVSIRGVTLPLGGLVTSCLACRDDCFTDAGFSDLPTTAVKTKNRTATASPPPRRTSLLLLIPSASFTSARVAKGATGSGFPFRTFDSRAWVGSCEDIGSEESSTVVGVLPFLLNSLTLMPLGSSLFAVAGDGWCERQTNQDRTIHLVRLGDLQKELFRRLFEIGSVEDNNPVGSLSRLKSGRAEPVVADLQLIRDDAFALLFLLFRGLASRDLDLRRNDLHRVIGGVQDGVGDHRLVAPLAHVADRRLDLLVLPLRPFGNIHFLLLPELLVEARKWR